MKFDLNYFSDIDLLITGADTHKEALLMEIANTDST